MNDMKTILPLARGNVWTGMPAFQWPAREVEHGCVRRARRVRIEMATLRLGLRPQPRSVRVGEFLGGRTSTSFVATVQPTILPEPKRGPRRDAGRSCFATLVLRHALLRMLLHGIAAARKPHNFRWHLQGIAREFYGCLRKK